MFKSHCPLLLYSAILYPPGLTSKLQTQILKHWDSQNLLFMHFYPIFLNPTEVEIITRIIAVCCSNFAATQNILHRHHTQHSTLHHTTLDIWLIRQKCRYSTLSAAGAVACYHFQAECMMHITINKSVKGYNQLWNATDSTQTVEALMDRIKLSKLSFSASQSKLNTKPRCHSSWHSFLLPPLLERK